MMNLWQFEFEMQDFSWIFTEYANTGTILSALTMSEIFGKVGYGHLWTREKALQLVNNLDVFIEDMIYLLGLTINGKKVLNFSDLMHQLIGGYLYSPDVIKLITGALANLKPLLEQYDPQGVIAGFVKELLEVDVHAWDKYTDDYDWGFENGDRKAFENALVEVLTPVSRVIQWLFCDREYKFFVDADGVADENRRGNTDQVVIYGAEGYAFGIVPILEAFNVPNIVTPADYSKNAAKDPSAEALFLRCLTWLTSSWMTHRQRFLNFFRQSSTSSTATVLTPASETHSTQFTESLRLLSRSPARSTFTRL